ncbi:hypothetical protein SAMN05518845_12165 [Variovorax sp. YR750]|nr:hypothetical protein SAMN05518845_12165 [Variovorax sp. YR750]
MARLAKNLARVFAVADDDGPDERLVAAMRSTVRCRAACGSKYRRADVPKQGCVRAVLVLAGLRHAEHREGGAASCSARAARLRRALSAALPREPGVTQAIPPARHSGAPHGFIRASLRCVGFFFFLLLFVLVLSIDLSPRRQEVPVAVPLKGSVPSGARGARAARIPGSQKAGGAEGEKRVGAVLLVPSALHGVLAVKGCAQRLGAALAALGAVFEPGLVRPSDLARYPHPRRNVLLPMQDTPHIDVWPVLDVEDQVWIARQRPEPQLRQIQFVRVPW